MIFHLSNMDSMYLDVSTLLKIRVVIRVPEEPTGEKDCSTFSYSKIINRIQVPNCNILS